MIPEPTSKTAALNSNTKEPRSDRCIPADNNASAIVAAPRMGIGVLSARIIACWRSRNSAADRPDGLSIIQTTSMTMTSRMPSPRFTHFTAVFILSEASACVPVFYSLSEMQQNSGELLRPTIRMSSSEGQALPSGVCISNAGGKFARAEKVSGTQEPFPSLCRGVSAHLVGASCVDTDGPLAVARVPRSMRGPPLSGWTPAFAPFLCSSTFPSARQLPR